GGFSELNCLLFCRLYLNNPPSAAGGIREMGSTVFCLLGIDRSVAYYLNLSLAASSSGESSCGATPTPCPNVSAPPSQPEIPINTTPSAESMTGSRMFQFTQCAPILMRK